MQSIGTVLNAVAGSLHGSQERQLSPQSALELVFPDQDSRSGVFAQVSLRQRTDFVEGRTVLPSPAAHSILTGLRECEQPFL